MGSEAPVLSAAERSVEDLALHRELSANLVGFCRLLRQHQVRVGPAEQGEALQALGCVDLGRTDDFCWALRTALAKNPREQEVFDRLFTVYWKVWERAGELNRSRAPVESEAAQRSPPVQPHRPAFTTISDWLKGRQSPEEEREAAGYSPFEVLTHRDFSQFRPVEMDEIARLIAALGRSLASRASRRFEPSRRGRLDLRHTIRASLRRGGDLIDLRFRRRRRQRLKLVLLCDVSKSMDLYSRFLIQFIYAFQSVYRRVETLVFSTGLHRITPTLKKGELDQVLAELAQVVPDWSGGTRIGESLHAFLHDYGLALVDHRTVVLIASDGWDTGQVELLTESLAELRRRARYLIWLNPLMGSPEYEPTCRGMQAALPHIDLLAPAHNVDSLRRLVRHLARVQASGNRRPSGAFEEP